MSGTTTEFSASLDRWSCLSVSFWLGISDRSDVHQSSDAGTLSTPVVILLIVGLRQHGRPPRRAHPDGQPLLSVHGPADALAIQQIAARRLSGRGPWRNRRRHRRRHTSRQRRKLLLRIAQSHGRHEEPSGQIQRFTIRRQIGKRYIFSYYHRRRFN